MANDFAKKLEDILRQELSVLRMDYNEVIAAIEEAPRGDSATVRFHPPYDDAEFDRPHDDMTETAFAARVARRLRVVLEAPTRPPGPSE